MSGPSGWPRRAGRPAPAPSASSIGAVYLLVGVLGLFINGSSDLNILNLNQPDNALHLASAALGLYFGLAGRRTATQAA